MKKIAVFPGSFDPFTIGHESIVRRALSVFDEIIIAVGANALKKSFYPVETRKKMIATVFAGEPRIKVDHYEGLTVDYCRKNSARFLLRGLRTAADFEFERAIAQVNSHYTRTFSDQFNNCKGYHKERRRCLKICTCINKSERL
jgi:pantetheine-phosphate adenylyltransferase